MKISKRTRQNDKLISLQALSIKATSLVGYERRTAKLTLDTGCVTFTFGDNNEAELYNFFTRNTGDLSYE